LFLVSNKVQAQQSPVSNSSLSALNGAWDGVLQLGGRSFKEHSLYYNGFVTNISEDSTGAWKDTHSGTYEISGNVYKQKILYSSYPARIGIIHWHEFKIEGDTLYLTFFKKIFDRNGKDVTSGMTPVEVKYVRAKM
jgi:hypothetical protein